MGASSEGGGDGDGGCCGVGDTSPGTIVWVRRRNGSWWPGRILGPDELPASQIMSPRSGTPVKLLGREDASVDWYNLEKSKRVKAFRCGEFDACIERAEATQGTLVKKREKYARREDAILHALELERKQLALKYQTQGFRPNDTSACTQQRKDLGSTRYKSKKSKKRKEDSSGPHDTKKDVEQYFLQAGSKKKFSESLGWGTSDNLVSNHMGDISDVRHMQGGTSLEIKEKSTAKKKNRSEGSDFEESLTEKSDRRRPLVQVLQSSAKLPYHLQHSDESGAVLIGGGKDRLPAFYQAKRSRCIYLPTDSGDTHSHGDLPSVEMTSTGAEFEFETESYFQQPGSFSEEHMSSDFVEKHISDSSESECSESETEDDAELLQTGVNKILPPKPRASDPYSLQAFGKFRHADNDDDDNDDEEEAAFSTYMPQLNGVEEEDGSSELGVSHWHMKGKRNNRNAAKRPMDTTDENPLLEKSNGFMKGSGHRTNERNRRNSSQQMFGKGFYQTKEELDYDSDETDLFEDTRHSEANRYHGKMYLSSLKATRDLGRSYTSFSDYENDSRKISPLNRDADQLFYIDRKPYWEGCSFYQRNCGVRLGDPGSMLLDVDLKVQASSYQGEHVPLVSLMSRLNGKAIVGHPIQIEILEDGSTDHLVSGGDISLEDSTAAPPVWRTGRRTAMQRVPRSNPVRATMDGDDEGGPPYREWEMRPHFNHQVRPAKKSMSNARRPLASKSQKKPSRKASLSSQKVRTLSSISTGKRHCGEGGQAKAHRRNDIFDGLIKPEGTVPLVTCVPAKVVFSRILETVGRPHLAVAHRVRMASPAMRNPP